MKDTIENSIPEVKLGDYVIIQRQKYMKLHRIGGTDSTAMLGKDQIVLFNALDKKYGTIYKTVPRESKMKRLYILEPCNETEIRNLRELLNVQESGTDNRHIIDDGESQALKAEDISRLREECSGSSEILERIVENSKTFNSKTEYAQEKYLKKKESKYCKFIQIRKPTIRLLAEIYYRQDPDKIMGIRIDTLSQMISYSGVCGYGNFLIYEGGSSGLVPAAFLNAIGPNTEGQLVHMHLGNFCQQQAILAMDFPEEQLNRCISVNIFSVLRHYYRTEGIPVDEENKTESTGGQEEEEIPKKRLRISDELNNAETFNESNNNATTLNQPDNNPSASNQPDNNPSASNQPHNNPRTSNRSNNTTVSTDENLSKWKIQNQRACELMKEKFDALVIVPREDPSTLIKALLPFLKSSRPIVIYNLSREILTELFINLRSKKNITGLHITSNWLRIYQILPNRTHPEVQMSGNGGYLLWGYTVG